MGAILIEKKRIVGDKKSDFFFKLFNNLLEMSDLLPKNNDYLI